jgi:hypothetical protein
VSHSGQPSRASIPDGLQTFKLHVSLGHSPLIVQLAHHCDDQAHDGGIVGKMTFSAVWPFRVFLIQLVLQRTL